MKNNFYITFRLKNTYIVNSILFSLKQLPLIKKILPNSLYSNDGLKALGNIISIMIEIGTIFLGKALYLLIMIYLASRGYKDHYAFLNIFFFLTIVGALMNTNMFNPTKDKYYAMILMKMDPRKYTLSNYYYFLLKVIIGFLPFTILFGLLAKIPLYICLIMPLLVVSLKAIYSAILLKYYQKSKKVVNENLPKPIVWILVGIFITMAYLLPEVFSMTPFIFMTLSIISIIGSIWAFKVIHTATSYSRIYKDLLNPDKIIFNVQKSVAANSQAEYLKKIAASDTVETSKKGYAYFNEIFMKRHRKILTESAKKMALISGLIIIAVALACLLIPETKTAINQTMLMYLPYFLFAMYFLNRGTVVTQAMFMNCDHSMLAYRFYRQPKAIILLFKERLVTLIKINMIPTIIIALGLPVLLWISGGTNNPLNYLILFTSIIAMAVFFSVHYMVLYYLLQPYNVNLEMKSTAYSIISSFTYLVCYWAIQIKMPTMVFGSVVTLFSILYIGISLIIAYRRAPKTFKLRN